MQCLRPFEIALKSIFVSRYHGFGMAGIKHFICSTNARK